jgi:hydroxysqualene dehydroxylase
MYFNGYFVILTIVKEMAKFDNVVIGGGLSGLSAAVELSIRHRKVLVLEQHRFCGGRTISHWFGPMKCHVDNGQHLMMGCYHATRQYLHSIGSENLTFLQPNLHIKFLHPTRKRFDFHCSKLPPPLHLITGLFTFSALSWKDRLKTLRVALAVLQSLPQKEHTLDAITVEQWLTILGQSKLSKQYLWDVITIGALNNYPKDVSALMLFRVLRAAFLGNRENASLLVPKVGLSELFVDPAVRVIEARGGEVRTGCSVKTILSHGNRVQSVQTNDGKVISATSFISAVPWYEAEKIIPALFLERKNSPYRSSPIIAIHLWFDRQITDLDFAAVIDTRIQWLFNKSLYSQADVSLPRKNTIQYLTLVVSGAEEYIKLSKEQLVEIAFEDLQRVLPEARNAKIVHSLVMKEKRATFSPLPGLEQVRPKTYTKFSNLFLAGDWTSTGYPATIEGAVLSGKNAARMDLAQQT